MYKHYGPAELGRMDIIEYKKALDVALSAGMPRELADKIWRKKGDKSYLAMMMPRKEQ